MCRPLPFTSKEEEEKELKQRKRFYESLEYFGIPTVFDEDPFLKYLSEKDREQYQKDELELYIILARDEEIPKDIEERLLKVKKLREQLNF